MDMLDRREFLNRSRQSVVTMAAGESLLSARAAAEPKPKTMPKVGAFTKSFQDWPIPEVCRRFKQIGLDGLDLTVRPGGHIDPKEVVKQLPQADRAAKEAGIEILFLTTSITEDDATAERILATAAEIGVDRIKMGYYRYKPFGTLAKQMAEVGKRIAKVARLAARYKVLPCVHIHSGSFIPSHGTQLYQLFSDFSPGEVGAYVDPLHMAMEGGKDGWRQGLDLLAPWVSLCAVKNFAWEATGRDQRGQLRWRTRTVPVADGVCPLPEFVATLKKIGFTGPYSIHSEYKGSHSFKRLDTGGCFAQTAKDLKYFRTLL